VHAKVHIVQRIDAAIGPWFEECGGWEPLVLRDLSSPLCETPPLTHKPQVNKPCEECGWAYLVQESSVHSKQLEPEPLTDEALHCISAHHGLVGGVARAIEFNPEQGIVVAAGNHKVEMGAQRIGMVGTGEVHRRQLEHVGESNLREDTSAVLVGRSP
jgi:hypothetical protein